MAARLLDVTPRVSPRRAPPTAQAGRLLFEMLPPQLERGLQMLARRVQAPAQLVTQRRSHGVQPRLDDAERRFESRALDLRRRGRAEIRGQADGAHRADEPLRRIPLIPADAVAEVRRKAVMERVIALAEGEERYEPVVA